MVADEVDYVVGVDTHLDEHVLAVVASPGGAVLAQRAVAANARGYAQALRFAQRYAGGARVWAIEGAGHYGAGLVRHLSERDEAVLEVGRSPRNERRLRGKDDQLDAVRAARAAPALPRPPPLPATAKPGTADGLTGHRSIGKTRPAELRVSSHLSAAAASRCRAR